MLDLKALRANASLCEQQLRRKEPSIDLAPLLQLDAEIREMKTEVEHLKAQRNALSRTIGEKKRQGLDCIAELEQVQTLLGGIDALDARLAEAEPRLLDAVARLPNLPDPDLPDGRDATENVALYTFGEKPTFSFPARHHLELNEGLQLFDFQRATKVSGAGWPAYVGWGARLEWALLQLMIDTHIRRGYTLWLPPIAVREQCAYGSAHLPKFADQAYRLAGEGPSHYLVPTAEMVLTGLYSEESLPMEELPRRLCAYTPCFRREAGAAGSAERGLIRMHQFNKVEMYCICHPSQAHALMEEMIEGAESILQQLGLHYHRMLLCTGDTSFAAARTVDIECWLPGQNRYYEVSSVSCCTDFQARRSGIRWKEGKESGLAYTLNGSGLATSRLMVALLEANQQADGSVMIPEVLRPWLDGLSVLTPQETGVSS